MPDLGEELVNASLKFKAKRFDASQIVEQYIPLIQKCGKGAIKEFRKMCKEYHVPQKQSFINRILMKNTDIEHGYDFKNIDVTVQQKTSLQPYALSTVYITNIKELKNVGFCNERIYYCQLNSDFFCCPDTYEQVEKGIDSTISTHLHERLTSIIKNFKRQ